MDELKQELERVKSQPPKLIKEFSKLGTSEKQNYPQFEDMNKNKYDDMRNELEDLRMEND